MRRSLVRHLGLVFGLLVMGSALAPPDASGQSPLFLVDENTTVAEVSFAFTGTQSFETERLLKEIATEAPGFWNPIERVLPLFEAEVYNFSPITLQKDVKRLQRFYHQRGFIDAQVHYYPTTRLDTLANKIHVNFTIREGPPLIIQDVGFYGPDSTHYAALIFEGALREKWIDFRNEITLARGARYTVLKRRVIEEEILEWLQNRGFAFADVSSRAFIDSTAHTVDLRYYLSPGPRARIAAIEVVGAEQVSAEVVRRELPFEVGDRFSRSALQRGQRELLGLSLFRLALVDLPQQSQDSTVVVGVQVEAAELHYVSAETGYARNVGLFAEGSWTHRNFLGEARNLTVQLTAETGLLAAPARPLLDQRLLRAAVSLHQPYLFVTKLSGTITPFVQFSKNPLFQPSNQFLEINAYEYGLSTTLTYHFLPLRLTSLQYTISRASNLTAKRRDVSEDTVAVDIDRDIYNRSILTLSGVFGQTDERAAPSRGFLIRPAFEVGGPAKLSGVQYVKLSGEVTGYVPLTDAITLTARLSAGHIWPSGSSVNQFLSPYENRFDLIRLYAGGANDVRGWVNQLLGPKYNRTQFARDKETDEIIFGSDDLPNTIDESERYEAIGGLAKLSANIELRLPFPGLGNNWRTAVFLDFGQVSTRRVADPLCEPSFTCSQAALFEDDGALSLNPSAFRYGAGVGVRYRTPVGYIRLDFAFKLNPGPLDLQTPRNAFLVANEEFLVRRFPDRHLAEKIAPEPHWFQRFNIHFSIGQAF